MILHFQHGTRTRESNLSLIVKNKIRKACCKKRFERHTKTINVPVIELPMEKRKLNHERQ